MPRKRPTQSVERERKFVVRKLPANLSRYPHSNIVQGYLAVADDAHNPSQIRVRRTDGRYVLTVKQGSGEARSETEVPLSSAQARSLWPLTRGRRVEKVRYEIPYAGHKVELDVYRGKARGLAVAEVEFPSQAALRKFEPPDWFGRDVSGNEKFSNSRLAIGGRRERRAAAAASAAARGKK